MKNARIAIYILTLCFCIVFVKCSKKNNAAEIRPDLVGEWKFEQPSGLDEGADLNISESGNGDYMSFNGGRTKSASAPAKLKGNTLKIGAISLEINSFPRDLEVAKGRFNKFMIIDGDTFFKKPKIKVDQCFNGFKDGDEIDIDCGGSRCVSCFTTACDNGLLENTIVITDCQFPPAFPDYEIFPDDVTKTNVSGYKLTGAANTSTLTIRFGKMPASTQFFQIAELPDNKIPGNDTTVVKLLYSYNNQVYSKVLSSGKIVVLMDEEFFSVTLCKHEVTFSGLDCRLVSAKMFVWKF